MIDALNGVLHRLTGLLLQPFADGSPWTALLVAALLSGLLAVLGFKYCSDQAAIRRQKKRVLARLLEIQIFRDDLPGIFSAFGRVLAAIGHYLKGSFKPLAVLALPLFFLWVHLAGWFEYRPLRLGETALVIAELGRNMDAVAVPATLTASPSLRVETDPFVSRAENAIIWRVAADEPTGPGWVDITLGHHPVRKSVSIGSGLRPVSHRRVRGGVWARICNPVEPALPPDAPFLSITVHHPLRPLYAGSTRVHWVVALLVLSLAVGLALKRPLRVEL